MEEHFEVGFEREGGCGSGEVAVAWRLFARMNWKWSGRAEDVSASLARHVWRGKESSGADVCRHRVCGWFDELRKETGLVEVD